MERPKRWLPLSMLIFFYWTASSSVMPILALFLSSRGLSDGMVGVLLALQALAPILFSMPCGSMADRIGHGRMILLGSVGMLLSGCFFLFSLQLLWLVVLAQLTAGLSQMMVWLSAQTLIVSETGEERRLNRSISIHSTYMAVGQAVGPMLGGFVVEHVGYDVNFLSYIGMSAVVFVAALTYGRGEVSANWSQGELCRRDGEKMLSLDFLVRSYLSGMHLLRRADVLFILCFTLMAAYILNQRSTFYPVFLEGAGWSASTVGMLISVGTAGTILVRSLVSLLLRRLSAPALMSLSLGVSILGMFLTPLYTRFYQLALASFFTGMALGLNQPLSLKMITEHTAPQERGLAMGLRIIANRFSGMVNPLTFGFISQFIGIEFAFYFIGSLLTVGLGWLSYRLWLGSDNLLAGSR